jgi:hypothetical protein
MDGEEPRYKALLTPVGFKIENIALMAALFKPTNLTPIFSRTTRSFHRRHYGRVEQKITEYCPDIIIEQVPPVESDDHRHMEQKVMAWWEKMSVGYGFSNDKMAIDLTGGTKPMTVGSQNAASSLNIPAFYLSVDYDEESLQAIPGTEFLIEMPVAPTQTDNKLLFVIMPFAPEFNGVYEAIKEVANRQKLRCVRADKEIYSGGIMDMVRENIAKAGTLVADLSLQNPNVYYELGLAHAWKKKVIMVSTSMEPIPFDLKHLRIVNYDSSKLDELTDKLVQEIEVINKEQRGF